MGWLVLTVALVIVAALAPRITSRLPVRLTPYGWSVRWVSAALALVTFLATSFIAVGSGKVAHLQKVYGSSSLQNGAIIAVNGEKGPQAFVYPEGVHFSPFINVLYDVQKFNIVDIKDGEYGYLIARDGAPLRADQTFADAFAPEQGREMLDAAFFLKNGGQKGPQTTVLPPGSHRLNRYLWDVQTGKKATEIEKGFVGVIKSNVWSRVDYGNLTAARPKECKPAVEAAENLAVPIMPVGCMGIWQHPLNPGRYYINEQAYNVTKVDTRVQTWEYKGGFRKRFLDLKVDQQGVITQTERFEDVSVPKEAADPAVVVKVEGWEIPQELRALVQVTPEEAPFVVAAVGSLENVEDRILTPAIRSIVRNLFGGSIKAPQKDKDGNPVLDDRGKVKMAYRPTRALDLIENRELLEDNVEEIIKPEGRKAHINIKEVRLGEPVLPPELLVARQREQLASQLARAFIEERKAQVERVNTEREKATADQQSKLVEADIEVQRSTRIAQARRNEGTGERDKLNMMAEGQRNQASVLGEDRVVELRKFEVMFAGILEFVTKNPGVVQSLFENAHKLVPERVITIGDGGASLNGLGAIIGDLMGPNSIKTAPPARKVIPLQGTAKPPEKK